MKKRFAILLALALLAVCCAGTAEKELTYTEQKTEAPVPLAETYPDNPDTPGISPVTGLPETADAYTPIAVVIEATEAGFPHWGVGEADIMFQVINMGGGNTKLMALFAGSYPERTGGCRSARATMVPVATAFDAAMAFGGMPPFGVADAQVNVKTITQRNGMRAAGKTYDLLSENAGFGFRETFLNAPLNLTCQVRKIHEDLVRRGTAFERRPFRFADAPMTEGDSASYIELRHCNSQGVADHASDAAFDYDPERDAYTRTNCNGDVDTDRDTGEQLLFANVIILRVNVRAGRDGYLFITKHMEGSGRAEFFMNGRHTSGAWFRETAGSRLVLLGPDGGEMALQRGKSFIVICGENTKAGYR